MPNQFHGTGAQSASDAAIAAQQGSLSILWVVVLTLAIIFAVYGLMLAYHWFAYGENKSAAVLTLAVYAAVGGFLLLVLASLALSISS